MEPPIAVAELSAAEESASKMEGDQSGDLDDEWEDITSLLASAAADMGVGQMVHHDSFSLYSAMSAIELMQPKMDVGCGLVRNVTDVDLPKSLSDRQVISIMDQLLACEATWMQAHSLPQTVFSCVYTQRMGEIPRPDLAAFIRIQLATMALVRAVVTTEQVAMEEDFIPYNFGFKLPVLTENAVAKLVRDAIAPMNHSTTENGQFEDSQKSLVARLKFLHGFHSSVSALAMRDCRRLGEAALSVERTITHLKVIENSWSRFDDDSCKPFFDTTINRHLLSNTPPRTAPVLSKKDALAVWSRSLEEFGALAVLRRRLLPPAPTLHMRPLGTSRGHGSSSRPKHPMYYSFHSLLHALCCFSAKWNPCVLTRSLLKRLLLSSVGTQSSGPVFGVEGLSISGLLLADMGLTAETAPGRIAAQAEELSIIASNIICGCLRNRGQQRRYLLRSLLDWDRAVLAITREPLIPAPPSNPAGHSDENGGVENSAQHAPAEDPSRTRQVISAPKDDDPKPGDLFEGKSALQLMAHEVTARLMMHHWFLGFECDLYRPAEYAPVFFYIGYVATTAANATAALANCGMQNAELHPCRYGLYLMDEARLWLCRAMFSLLEALELGREWNYAWRGARRYALSPKRTGEPNQEVPPTAEAGPTDADDASLLPLESDELRYEQRFGRMAHLLTGPQFMSYQTFVSLLKLQRDALMARDPESTDEVFVRLSDAACGFKMAREALERAQRAGKACSWDPLTEESLQLARVAVSNSILIPRLRRMHQDELDKEKQSSGLSPTASPCTVAFGFKQHRHFPVVSVVPD